MSKINIFRTTGRIVMGAGSLDTIGDEVKALGGTRILVVTDPGLASTGIVDRLEKRLSDGGLNSARYDRVEPDPRLEIVDEATAMAKSEGVDVIIGIGGGSPLDIAKTTAILTTNGGSLKDFVGIDQVPKPGLDTILIPTTAGTGSEVTPIAILTDEQEKLKKGIVSPFLFPKTAILDPELTLGLPPAITASTGMDALIHAIEAYTSKNATPMTDLFALRAMELLFDNIRTVYANGENLDARTAMLEGSTLAGMAFANAGVTAVHAFAYPIGAEFHIPHGVANSIMLAPVMEFNMLGNLQKFADIADVCGEATGGMPPRRAAQLAVDAIRLLSKDLDVPMSLGAYGIKEAHIPDLAAGVMKVTRLLANNPRVLKQEDAETIYRSVL